MVLRRRGSENRPYASTRLASWSPVDLNVSDECGCSVVAGPHFPRSYRWHAAGGHRGWVLAETSDAVALGRWMQEWTDHLEFEITPVNDDEAVMKVLGE